MPIIIRPDRVMADRKMSLNELSAHVALPSPIFLNLKNAKISAVKLSTPESICKALNCQPGDLMEYAPEKM